MVKISEAEQSAIEDGFRNINIGLGNYVEIIKIPGGFKYFRSSPVGRKPITRDRAEELLSQ